jgi:hypothetical protein
MHHACVLQVAKLAPFHCMHNEPLLTHALASTCQACLLGRWEWNDDRVIRRGVSDRKLESLATQ